MPKAIHLLVNQMLPEHLRSNDHTYDKKDINEMVRAVSVEDPERYASFVNGLKDLGRKSVYLQGATLRLSDFEAGFDKEAIYKSMDNELAGLDLIKDDSLRLKRKMIIYGKYAEQLTDLAMKAGRAKGSSLAGIIASGARGNPAQYRAMTTTPALYTDYKDDPIDMFVRRSFAEGVRPIDFLASTFGTRKATIATKACWMQGTRVRMADLSTKNIEDIVVGDRVLGSDNAGSVAPVKVTKTFDQGMQDVYEYELGLNSSNTTYTKLRCTEDHKILQFSPKAYRKAYSQFYRGSRPTPPDDSLLNSREVLPAKELTKRYFKACIASGTYDKRQPDALSVRSFKLLGLRPCYDIEVDNDSHLFVLASGVIGSNSTADAGDLGKLLVQNGLPVMVNSKRSTTPSGILLHPDEDEIRGRVLARPAAGYAAGTVVTRKVETAIRNKHKGRVMVYSPLSEVGADGISGEAFGVNYDGVIPGPGFSAGVTAGNALSEPIAQGSLNCLVADTQVLMSDFTEKSIQDLVPGDMVMGADVKGDTFPTRVTHVWDQGLQPAQRRVYKMGSSSQRLTLESTAAHPVLSNRKTYGLKPGKMNRTPEKLIAGYNHKNIAAVLPVNCKIEGVIEPWAVFLGAYLGDGIRWNPEFHAAPSFSCADSTEVDDLNVMLDPLNIKLKKVKRSYDYAVVMKDPTVGQYRDMKTGHTKEGLRSPIKLKLLEWGIDGVYAHEKKVPACVWKYDRASVAGVVAGFIATDGSVYKNKEGHIGVSFASCSYELLYGLKQLLARRLNVYSSKITKTGSAGEGNRVHDMWAFTITRLDQVSRLAEFISDKIPGVKRERLEALQTAVNYKGLNRGDEFYRAIRKDSEEQDLGLQQCYDITVEHGDSLFVLANGLIVSNTKHSGGAFTGGKKVFSGFDYISQFVQVPDTFKDRASVSELGGKVERIEDAPQGGKYVTVEGEKHYVLPDLEVSVNVGDNVEPGDALSDGLINPRDVIRLRGLGEGRRYYSRRLKQMLDDSGQAAQLRNTEVIARGALDAVQIGDDGHMGYLPGSVVSYNKLEAEWVPRKDAESRLTRQSEGRYLEAPLLHYTIGTKLTSRMLDEIQEAGFDSINSHNKPPPFEPIQIRLRTNSYEVNPDWLARTGSSYLQKNLSESAQRGYDTNLKENTHPLPRLAVGVNFGDKIKETGKF